MYNNPFMYNQFMGNQLLQSNSLFGGLRAINWSSILSGTSKTLGVINQAIPIVYQIKPIINNAKTMFKIANTINNSENEVTSNDNNNNNDNLNTSITNNINKPTFYI